MDTNWFLRGCQALDSVELKVSENPKCMIDVTASVCQSVPSLQELSNALREVWNHLLYPDFEASAIFRYREATVLRFVTAIETALFVTGQIKVSGVWYPKLADKYERDFHSLPSIGES